MVPEPEMVRTPLLKTQVRRAPQLPEGSARSLSSSFTSSAKQQASNVSVKNTDNSDENFKDIMKKKEKHSLTYKREKKKKGTVPVLLDLHYWIISKKRMVKKILEKKGTIVRRVVRIKTTGKERKQMIFGELGLLLMYAKGIIL